MKLTLYHDDHDFPRAEVETPYEVLGWFLEQDVQSSVSWCKELVGIIETIQCGRKARWEGTGNAHTLVLTQKRVRIENEYTDPPQSCELSLHDFENAILEWSTFIQKPIGSRLERR